MAPYQAATRLLRNLPKTLARLRRREHSWHASGTKYALMRLLRSIFTFYRSLRSLDLARVATRRLAELADSHWRARQHPLRTIIDAVSKAERRTKSRWTRALRYAW